MIVNYKSKIKEFDRKIQSNLNFFMTCSDTTYEAMSQRLEIPVSTLKEMGIHSSKASYLFEPQDVFNQSIFGTYYENSRKFSHEMKEMIKYLGDDKLEWMEIDESVYPVNKGCDFFIRNYCRINMYGDYLIKKDVREEMKLELGDILALSAVKCQMITVSEFDLEVFLKSMCLGPPAFILRYISKRSIEQMWIKCQEKIRVIYDKSIEIKKESVDMDKACQPEMLVMRLDEATVAQSKTIVADKMAYDEIAEITGTLVSLSSLEKDNILNSDIKKEIVLGPSDYYYWYEQVAKYMLRRELVKKRLVCKSFYKVFAHREKTELYRYSSARFFSRKWNPSYDSYYYRQAVVNFIHESYVLGGGLNYVVEYDFRDHMNYQKDIQYLFYALVKYLLLDKGTIYYYKYLKFYCEVLTGIWKYPYAKMVNRPLMNMFLVGSRTCHYSVGEQLKLLDVNGIYQHKILKEYNMQLLTRIKFKPVEDEPVIFRDSWDEKECYMTGSSFLNYIESKRKIEMKNLKTLQLQKQRMEIGSVDDIEKFSKDENKKDNVKLIVRGDVTYRKFKKKNNKFNKKNKDYGKKKINL